MSKTMDADMTHVAYKGEAPMIQELIGGQLQLCFSSAQNTKPFIDSGRLKAIGVTGTAAHVRAAQGAHHLRAGRDR